MIECCCADSAICRVAMAGSRVSGSGIFFIVQCGIVWQISLCTRAMGSIEVQRSNGNIEWVKQTDKAQTMA